MDTKKVIKGIIVFLLAVFFFRIFVVYKIVDGLMKTRNWNKEFMAEVEKKMNCPKMVGANDDKNMPDYIENLAPSDETLKIFDKRDRTISLAHVEKYNMYNSEYQTNRITVVNEDIKEANLDLNRIKTDLNKEMERLMREPKKSEQPSFEECKNLNVAPTYKKIRDYVNYWCGLSWAYDADGDSDTALLLIHFGLYLVRDLETSYSISPSVMTRMISCGLKKEINTSVLMWARNPKPKSKELSKKVAKDILDFLKTELPLSNTFNCEKAVIKEMLNGTFKTIGYGMGRYCNSKSLDQKLDSYFKEPTEYIDKPFLEIRSKLDKQDKETDKIYNNMELAPGKFFTLFFNAENYFIDYSVLMYGPRFKRVKESQELGLAKMEMAAIALAINSYYCEKNKLPKSMEELSKWFGEELPKNRFTDEPYEIKSDEEHTLINEGIDGVTTSSRDYIFFDFKATKPEKE